MPSQRHVLDCRHWISDWGFAKHLNFRGRNNNAVIVLTGTGLSGFSSKVGVDGGDAVLDHGGAALVRGLTAPAVTEGGQRL